jgi:hypothetical protein
LEILAPTVKTKALLFATPLRAQKFSQNNLCKPQVAEVGSAFEAFESFADNGLDGGHFVVSTVSFSDSSSCRLRPSLPSFRRMNLTRFSAMLSGISTVFMMRCIASPLRRREGFSRALMLSHGQRPRKQLGHHIAMIEFARKNLTGSSAGTLP